MQKPNHGTNEPEYLARFFAPRDLAWLIERREHWQEQRRSLSVCDAIAHEVAARMGWRWAKGSLELPFETCAFHCWCLLPDDTIFDPSADQFFEDEENRLGQLDGLRFVLAGSVQHAEYVPKFIYGPDGSRSRVAEVTQLEESFYGSDY